MGKNSQSIRWNRRSPANHFRPKHKREYDLVVKLKTQKKEFIHRLVTEKRFDKLNRYGSYILESITDAYYGLDTHWCLTYINRIAGLMQGEDYKQLLGKNLWECFPSLVGSVVEENYKKAMAEQVPVHFETPSHVFPGIIFEIHAYPTPEGLNVYYRDITEQKKMQQQFYEMKKMEAIGQFAGGVAHDLNNQLVIITSLTDLRLQHNVTNRQVLKDFIQIRNAAGRAADLTRQILLFSQNYPQRYTLLDFNDEIRSSQSVLQNLAGNAITIQYQLMENLWPVNADSANIVQVLENLILNARDAMPQGGLLTIGTDNILLKDADCREHKDAVPGRFVRLSIRDHGSGMNDAVLAKIFEPFFTTRDLTVHRGLGLSVVYGIVKSHQGWIQATSQVNEGTCFQLYFPAEIEE